MGNKLRETEKEKIAIIKSCIEGINTEMSSKEHGISSATFYNWQKKYRETELNLDGKFVPVVSLHKQNNLNKP